MRPDWKETFAGERDARITYFDHQKADVEDMGSSFVVVTDNDPGLARQQADRLARWLVTHRENFRGEMISPEAA